MPGWNSSWHSEGWSAAAAAAGITVPSGLLIYFAMNDITPTTVIDTQGFQNGVANANVSYQQTGQINKAFNFNSNNQSQLALVTFGTFQGPQTGFSCCLWIKPTNLVLGYFCGVLNTGTGNMYVQFFMQANGQFNGRIGNATGGMGTFIGKQTAVSQITTGGWQHVAMTWDGGTASSNIALYHSGTQIDIAVDQANPPITGPYAGSGDSTWQVGNGDGPGFGAGNTNTAVNIDSLIDDFRIYNRGLSSSEITAIYNSGIIGNP